MSSGRRGKDTAAHSELNRGLCALGEGLVTTGGRRRSRWPEEEEDVGDSVPRLFPSRGSVGRSRRTARSSWAQQRGEGVAVAVVVLVGGDGGVRAERTEEGEEAQG